MTKDDVQFTLLTIALFLLFFIVGCFVTNEYISLNYITIHKKWKDNIEIKIKPNIKIEDIFTYKFEGKTLMIQEKE